MPSSGLIIEMGMCLVLPEVPSPSFWGWISPLGSYPHTKLLACSLNTLMSFILKQGVGDGHPTGNFRVFLLFFPSVPSEATYSLGSIKRPLNFPLVAVKCHCFPRNSVGLLHCLLLARETVQAWFPNRKDLCTHGVWARALCSHGSRA